MTVFSARNISARFVVRPSARIGDWVIIEGLTLDDGRRQGQIIELIHADGSPPYRVRWTDGHDSVFHPGAGARIEEHPAAPAVRLRS